MIQIIIPPLIVVSIILLVLGKEPSQPWALYVLKFSWLAGLGVAGYFTMQAWGGSAHSENWAMIGMIFIVWPITGFVSILAIAELLILRGRVDRHARCCRFLAILISGLLIILSVSPIFVGGV